jgi:hypothetical protein
LAAWEAGGQGAVTVVEIQPGGGWSHRGPGHSARVVAANHPQVMDALVRGACAQQRVESVGERLDRPLEPEVPDPSGAKSVKVVYENTSFILALSS